MKTLIAVMGAGLLVLSSLTVSNARPYARTQSGPDYYRPDYDSSRDRDNSCFSRSTGLPNQFACSGSGGG